jgi:hypothetical protein
MQAADVGRLAAEWGEHYCFDEEAAQTAMAHERLFNILDDKASRSGHAASAGQERKTA